MKKLFLLSTMVCTSFVFANNAKIEGNLAINADQSTNEMASYSAEKEGVALRLRWWSVGFTNACGQHTVVLFQSENEDGSPEFNAELAYAVNTGYSDCLN